MLKQAEDRQRETQELIKQNRALVERSTVDIAAERRLHSAAIEDADFEKEYMVDLTSSVFFVLFLFVSDKKKTIVRGLHRRNLTHLAQHVEGFAGRPLLLGSFY